jgi:hypothetical protein
MAAALPFHSRRLVLSAPLGDWQGLAFLIYVIIGIVVAWNHGYIFFAWLKTTASILLAVSLCWLILLGVNVHVP